MCLFFPYVSYTGSLLVDFGSGKSVCVCFSRMSVTLALCWSTSAVGSVCVCVCLFFPYVSYTGSLLVDFDSVKCVCLFLFLYVSYTGSLLVDFGSGKCVCVCVFVLVHVCQLHWLFASRLRQWDVCVCLFFPYVSYTGSLLVDFGSGKCVCVCLSRMSVTLALC